MMETIGTRRVLTLAILLGINLLIAAAIYLWISPQSDYYTAKAIDLKHKVSAARAHTAEMTTQLETVQKQKEGYQQLQGAGFFAAQDRGDARDRILAAQKFSRVLTASYDIKPAETDGASEKLKLAGQAVLSTPVEITVEAVDDIDLYNFVSLIKNGLPGYVAINSMEISRVHDLDEGALRDIANGAPPALINGKISYTWKTVTDATDIKPDSTAKTGI